MPERWLLKFRSARGDMTFSCVVAADHGDELKGEIERRAMRLERETRVPWICESVNPMSEAKEADNE